jgi:RNA polymerase sigma-70 factor (ECF subfamily)
VPFSAFPEHDQHELEDSFGQLADPDSLPDEAAQRRERAAEVRKCIEALPAKQQQVIYLRFYVGDSLGGIAAALGCSVGTVKSRLFHALERLRGMNVLNEQRGTLKEEVGML